MNHLRTGAEQLVLVIATTLLGSACVAGANARTQPVRFGSQPFLDEFLEELSRYKLVESETTVGFAGSYREIPVDLGGELERLFPNHRVAVAQMWFVDIGPQPVDLVVVTNRASGRVETFAWATWFEPLPPSFNSFLNQYEWGPYCSIEPAATAIAQLLAFTSGRTLGEVKKDDIFGGCPGVTCRFTWDLRRMSGPQNPKEQVVVEVQCHRSVEVRIEASVGGPASNNRVNATVGPVTALAKDASAAPVPSARYAERYADKMIR